MHRGANGKRVASLKLVHERCTTGIRERPALRGKPGNILPWCWQRKAALRRIREAFDADKTVTSALAVYVALTEIASDEESDEFTTTHAYISQKCGVSPRTVQDRLNELSDIHLVQVITPALKSPSTYRLLSVQQPLPNVRQRTK